MTPKVGDKVRISVGDGTPVFRIINMGTQQQFTQAVNPITLVGLDATVVLLLAHLPNTVPTCVVEISVATFASLNKYAAHLSSYYEIPLHQMQPIGSNLSFADDYDRAMKVVL